MKRVFLIVLDSLGIGEMEDAYLFNDEGSNTLKALYNYGNLQIPNLLKLGIGNVDGVNYLPKTESPLASFCRLKELSKGKCSTVGHFEIAGVVTQVALPTYPNGFPTGLLNEVKRKTGYDVLCNKPYSGTEVIKDYGDEHLKTGKPIVYTSADSVFQIACHEEKFGLEKLYDLCGVVREICSGEDAVGRVIARPFVGEDAKSFKRTENRKDYSLSPPSKTMMNILAENKLDCISIGKIASLYNFEGFNKFIETHNNKEGMAALDLMQQETFEGLCFANLVDFDMLYGHRNDAMGYCNALNVFDLWLAKFIKNMQDEDMLLITADHGCDPTTSSTDHSREFVPLLIYGKNLKRKNFGTVDGLTCIADTILEKFNISSNFNEVKLIF